MTLTAPPESGPASRPALAGRRRRSWLIVLAVLLATAAGVAGTIAVVNARDEPNAAGAPGTSQEMRDYYDTMMRRYGLTTAMMGGRMPGSMMDGGYTWMMGGAAAPGWLSGGSLPGSMMGGAGDPGRIMGQLFADAPGPRVDGTDAAALGNRIPANATVNSAENRITFSGTTEELIVLAGSDEDAPLTYRIAGLTNPTVSVPTGAEITLTVINADADMAHGIVVTGAAPPYPWMPMMSAVPAFTGAAVWFLGESSSAGMHEATVHFTAGQTGSFYYICGVPGHARQGMFGEFLVG